jgi:hypothetical protein
MKSSILILSFFVCSGLNAQKENLNLIRWHASDKVEASDYQLIRNSDLYCFISNDNDNLYFDVKVKDQGTQNRILKEGLTIWISMDGKEEKKMGVRFPVGSQNQGAHRKTDHQENNSVPDGNPVNPIALANTIEIIGFTTEQQRHFPSDNHDSFRGSVKCDEAGILYCKLVIPIMKLPVRNTRAVNGAMPFILGIEYGYLPVMNKQAENRGPRPSSLFHSGSSGSSGSKLYWINNVRLATSK